MKKLLGTSLLILISLPLWTAPASARTFGLIPHQGCFGGRCGRCCSSYFCVKQYNAFSPVACGSLYLDGCNPFSANGGACGAGGINYGGTPCGGCAANPAVANPNYAYGYAPQPAPAYGYGYGAAPAYGYAPAPAYGPPPATTPPQPNAAIQASYQSYYAPMTPMSVQPNAGRPWYWDTNGR
jgi:hypothetical protein